MNSNYQQLTSNYQQLLSNWLDTAKLMSTHDISNGLIIFSNQANKQAFYDSENAVLRPRNRRLIFENRRFTTWKPLFCGQLFHTFKIIFHSSFVCTPLGFRRFACRRTFVDKRSSLLGERQSRNSLRRAAEPKLS